MVLNCLSCVWLVVICDCRRNYWVHVRLSHRHRTQNKLMALFLVTNEKRWITQIRTRTIATNAHCPWINIRCKNDKYFSHWISLSALRQHFSVCFLLSSSFFLARIFIDTIFMRVYQSFRMAQLSRKLEKALIFFPFFRRAEIKCPYIFSAQNRSCRVICSVHRHTKRPAWSSLRCRLSVAKQPYRMNLVSVFS